MTKQMHLEMYLRSSLNQGLTSLERPRGKQGKAELQNPIRSTDRILVLKQSPNKMFSHKVFHPPSTH